MDAIYKFEPNAHYLRTVIRRYRRQQPLVYRPEGQFAVLVFLFLVVALYARLTAAPWQPAVNEALAVVVLLSVLSVPLISLLIHRRLQKRADPNATITVTLSDNGIHGDGPTATTQVTWQAYSRAVRFVDGIMLIRKGSIRWLPDAALQNQAPEMPTKLVSSKLPVRSVA